MEKRKETILLDIDEVLCFSGYLELVNEFLNTNYTIDDFSDYYIDEATIPKEKMGEFCEFMKIEINMKTLCSYHMQLKQ